MSTKILSEASCQSVDLNVDTSRGELLFENAISSSSSSSSSSSASSKLSSVNEVGADFTSINSIVRKAELISKFNKIVIGDLAKDFLRVKLTSDQVKRIKQSIKRAKRSELAAILNNKTPENPTLSFEMRHKLRKLSEEQLLDDDDKEKGTTQTEEPWRQRCSEVSKSYEKKRQQMLQDEYLAKLIQNEEFLNEIRTDKDFIQTLNYGKLMSY